MNRSITRKVLTGAWLSIMTALSALPAHATFLPYNWLLTVETEDVPNQFKYPGSKLTPLVKARVFYANMALQEPEQIKYETIWYCNGKAYGLDRFTTFGVDQGVSVGIKVIHKSNNPTQSDYEAAANSILRLLIDLRVNRSMLTNVTVPDQSWGTVLEALAREHYIPLVVQLEVPYMAPGAFFLQDDSGRRKTTLWYSPNH